MRLHFRALTLAVGVLVFGLPGLNFAADSSFQAIEDRLERFVREERLHNVVKIDAGEGVGYGLIFGRNFESLLVVTARHILPEDFVIGTSSPGTDPVVRLYGVETNWRAIPGRVYELPPTNRVHDVAVIEVSVPGDPRLGEGNYLLTDSWRKKVIDADPSLGTRVELAATVNDIGYAGGSARISCAEDDCPEFIEGLKGESGQSGAPIATDRGFVAMYLGSGAQQAIPLVDIHDAIVAEFGAPFWALLPVDPRPVSTRLCVRVHGAHVSEVSVFGPYGRVDLNERGCADTSTAPHSISGTRFGLICVPRKFLVTADGSDPYAITCTFDPTGRWTTSGQGFLQLESVGNAAWQLRLMLPHNRGQIRGKVTGSPPNLFLNDGRFRGRTPVSGSIIIEGDALRIDFSTGLEFFEGVYRR